MIGRAAQRIITFARGLWARVRTLVRRRAETPVTMPSTPTTPAREPESTADTTFGVYAERWLARNVAGGMRSKIDYDSVLRRYILPRFGATPIGEIRPRDVRAFLAELAAYRNEKGREENHKMRTFKKMAAQGDVVLRKIGAENAALPEDAVLREMTDRVVIAHSETGHHHAIMAPPSVVQFFGSSDPLKGYLSVRSRPVELKHERPFDTHETIKIKPGVYEVRRQREHTPEGWRRVED